MPVKRLIDSVIFGFGSSAGAKLFEEACEEVSREEPPPPPPPDPKAAKRAKKKRDAEIEKELAALKRRIRR